jgi:hypothetical protein
VSGVPQSYIVNRLHSFAEKFWWEPESADVRVCEYGHEHA